MISESLSPSDQSTADTFKEEETLLEKRWEVSPEDQINIFDVCRLQLTTKRSETSQICPVIGPGNPKGCMPHLGQRSG